MGRRKPKTCDRKDCENVFTPKRVWARFCSNECRRVYHMERRDEALDLLESHERQQAAEASDGNG